MSPNFEPVTISGQRYSLRHVGPRAAVFPSSPAPNVTVLGRTDMVAKRLPCSDAPGSPDFVSGSWTTRLDDAGEFTLTFPNTISSDGVPWRSRFAADGHTQWIEIYDNHELDFVGCIAKIDTDDQKVVISGGDAMWLLKKAYVRDWITVQSPRDVMERATQLWVPVTADNFPAGALDSQWTTTTNLGGTVSVGQSGGLKLAIPGASGALAAINGLTPTVGTSAWAATCTVQVASLPTLTLLQLSMADNADTYALRFFNGMAQLWVNGTVYEQVQLPSAPSHNLALESDGEWIWGFLDGQRVGAIRRLNMPAIHVNVGISLANIGPASAASATITGVLAKALQPFLQ